MNAYIHTMTVTDENGEESIFYPQTKQEAVDGLEERLAKLEVADITETEDTTLENSHAGRLLFTEINGAMEQGENPSPTNPQEIENVAISGIRTHDGNGNESAITFSQPIELYGLDDVRDILTSKQIKRKVVPLKITDFRTISVSGDTNWYDSTKSYSYEIKACNYPIKNDSLINDLCTHFETYRFANFYGNGIENGVLSSQSYIVVNISKSLEICKTIDEFRQWCIDNDVTFYKELAEETTEELPIADQIALNSLQTFDGTTHVEFVSDVQPTFSAKYGTTEMGGMTLESLLTARSNDLRLSALETSVVNNI